MTRTLVIALLTLGDPDRLTGGYLYHRRMAEAAARHDARIEFVSFPDHPLAAALATPAALRSAARLGAQVVVLDSIVAPLVGAWPFLRSFRLPLVAMLHQPPGGIDHGSLRTRLQARLDRRAYARARRLLAASESLKDELVRLGEPLDRIRVVPPGRDVAKTSVGGCWDSPAVDLRAGRRAAFLCVGNWVERKGIHSLLEAFSRLPPDAGTLHLAGDDRTDRRYAARLRSRLTRPDLAGRVVVHGPLPQERLAALYAAADVFVLTSIKEPYGTVYGEAMAFGLPVVGWRAGNLPYLADDEREGLLLAPGDVSGLARALARLANDSGLRQRLGQAAARRARSFPTWDETTGLFFAAITEAVETAETRSPTSPM